jgi:hypothetical protein
LNEYRKYIEKDPALARRFQSVFVPEPTVQDTISILRGRTHTSPSLSTLSPASLSRLNSPVRVLRRCHDLACSEGEV